MGLMLLSGLLMSCTALRSQTPVTADAPFAEAPDACYQRATRAWARLGGTLTQANAQVRILSGTVHNAVALTVVVTPTPTGCTIAATGTLLPDKFALGKFDEVQRYMTLLQES
jgi:hypothetical protein